MKKLLIMLLLPGILLGCDTKKSPHAAATTSPPVAKEAPAARVNTFTNPIYPNGADPWLEYFDGNYYLTTTTWTSQLVMRKSPTLEGLATATPIHIWSESDLGRCCNFWAFEFHRLKTEKGYRWYVMYTSGIAENFDRQHLSVIESQGDDPLGPYTYKGSPMPDTWNIDGNYFEHKGQLYLLWSEWIKDEQSILIAKMTNPWTITGEKVVIARPHYEWETSGMKVNEGPEMLIRNGKIYMVYSASFCNTPDYKLGLMELVGEDPLKPESWHKFDKPVFSKANGVFGPGHNGFFKSPDGTEDWLIYHGNASEKEGCSSTRSLRAQKFTWNDNGTPNFGEPVAAGQPVVSPSGENGPLVTKVQGTQVQLINKANEKCVVIDANGKIVDGDCTAEQSRWNLDYTTDGNYRLVSSAGLFLGEGVNKSNGQCVNTTAGELNASPWHNQICQQWQLTPYHQGWLTLVNAQSKKELGFAGCEEPVVQPGKTSVEDIPLLIEKKSACVQWRVQPVGNIALTSVQSGKAVTPANNSASAGAAIEQDEWNSSGTQQGLDAQQWNFVHAGQGYYHVQSKVNAKLCLSVAHKSIVPGTAVELAECGDTHSQWQVDFLNDGTVKMANRKSTLPLDLANCGVADHIRFAQGHWFNTPCQKFQLKPIQ